MKDEMDAYNDSIDEMWYEIKNAPTIEIVRCKDCVEGSYKTVIDGDNVKWCDIVGMNVLDDDFCSWARMKGGDADIPKNQSIMQQSRHDDGKDLISRADAIEAVKHSTAYMHDDLYEAISIRIPSAETTGALDDAIAKYVADGYMLPPSANRPTGEWEHTITWQPYCSNCEYVFGEDEEFSPFWKYCPMCGARMENTK